MVARFVTAAVSMLNSQSASDAPLRAGIKIPKVVECRGCGVIPDKAGALPSAKRRYNNTAEKRPLV